MGGPRQQHCFHFRLVTLLPGVVSFSWEGLEALGLDRNCHIYTDIDCGRRASSCLVKVEVDWTST